MRVSAAERRHTARIMLRGHLFDNAIINKMLDIVEGVDGALLNVPACVRCDCRSTCPVAHDV